MTNPTGPTPRTPIDYALDALETYAHPEDPLDECSELIRNARARLAQTENQNAALLAALKELLDTADVVAFYDAPERKESDEYEAAQEKARAAIRAAEGAE
jgi:Arc/MetJ-type ribon-helix-helix transcriptional regulator